MIRLYKVSGDGPARSSVLAIVVCPGCQHKLRVPDGKRGTVTCPHCGAEWFHPETIELSEVEFRCSKSGARFNVISSRRSPLHKFVVQKINKATDGASRPAESEPLSSSQQPALKAGAPDVRLAAPRGGGWLARIVGRKSEVASATPATAGQATGTTIPVATHNADEYNWSGFSCPYCGASSFVSGACGHLACNGTTELRNGRHFHQCFCGHAGFISGTITAFEGKRLSVEREVGSAQRPIAESQQQDSRSVGVALPSSTHTSPAKR
jgi:hypothetical protein